MKGIVSKYGWGSRMGVKAPRRYQLGDRLLVVTSLRPEGTKRIKSVTKVQWQLEPWQRLQSGQGERKK